MRVEAGRSSATGDQVHRQNGHDVDWHPIGGDWIDHGLDHVWLDGHRGAGPNWPDWHPGGDPHDQKGRSGQSAGPGRRHDGAGESRGTPGQQRRRHPGRICAGSPTLSHGSEGARDRDSRVAEHGGSAAALAFARPQHQERSQRDGHSLGAVESVGHVQDSGCADSSVPAECVPDLRGIGVDDSIQFRGPVTHGAHEYLVWRPRMEQLDLTTPETKPPLTSYRVVSVHLDWDQARIVITLIGSDGINKRVEYTGPTASSIMRSLNTADLSVKSLHRRIIERLQADGILALGTLSGLPG